MTDEEARQLFETNEKFHDYVMRFCKTTGDTIEQALRKKIIKSVGKEYDKGGVNEN